MIIGLTSPYPRAGKDTTADMLEKVHGFYRDSFGRGIYEEASAAFGVTIEQLGSHEWKTQPQKELAIENCTDPGFRKAVRDATEGKIDFADWIPQTSRFILQQWGTEYRRKEDELYWVNSLKERIDPLTLGDMPDIVITDVREPHEVQYLYALAAYTGQKLMIIEITRDAAAVHKTSHSSDAGLPRHFINHTIQNVEGRADIMLNEVIKLVFPSKD